MVKGFMMVDGEKIAEDRGNSRITVGLGEPGCKLCMTLSASGTFSVQVMVDDEFYSIANGDITGVFPEINVNKDW